MTSPLNFRFFLHSLESKNGVLDEESVPTTPTAATGNATTTAAAPSPTSNNLLDEPGGVFIVFRVIQPRYVQFSPNTWKTEVVVVNGSCLYVCCSVAKNAEDQASSDDSSDDEESESENVLRTETQPVPFTPGEFDIHFSKAILIEMRRRWSNLSGATLVFNVNVVNRASSTKSRTIDKGVIPLQKLLQDGEFSISSHTTNFLLNVRRCTNVSSGISCHLPQIFAPIQQIFRLRRRRKRTGKIDYAKQLAAMEPQQETSSTSRLASMSYDLSENPDWMTVVDQVFNLRRETITPTPSRVS